MKRSAQISQHLEVCEALFLQSPELFESWHGTFLKVARRHFDSSGGIKEGEFETLEKIRHRVDPPKASFNPAVKESLDKKLSSVKVHDVPTCPCTICRLARNN